MVLSSVPRFVVLGAAGAIGRIIVRDLFESSRRNEILAADYDREGARNLSRSYRSGRVSHGFGDARDPRALASLLAGSTVVVNCTRHQFNLNVMQAALRARAHYLDLGGLFVWTRRQLRLKGQFADAGLTAVLGMGCAPGLSNVMAAAAGSGLDRVESIRIRVGGIDFNTAGGAFAFPYSAQTILEELTLPPWKWSGGRFVQSEPRSGWEWIDFGPPVGRISVVMTRHSEIATLPARFRKKGLRYADFKVGFDRGFVREVMRRIRAGWTVRDFEADPAARASRAAPNDYEITRVAVKGGRRTVVMECHARANPKWHASAGDIDTACPASIVAQMIAQGVIGKPGVWAPEDIVPADLLFEECRQRGMQFNEKGRDRL
jgi:saccharopine dehydrogenase-like NADP-dependent oxidoreductase